MEIMSSAYFQRFDLSGRTALVTGASQGIGQGIAIGLAQHGADVAIICKDEIQTAEGTVQQIRDLGRKVWVFQQDLGRVEDLGSVADRVWEETGGIDILVNNAGVAFLHHFHDVTWGQWQAVMNVNLAAAFFLTQRISALMIGANKRGRVINISSKNGLVAEAGLAPYNISKGGLELMTQSLAIELGPFGITVNSIAPGWIETKIGEKFDLDPAFIKYYQEHIPLEGRFGTIEDCVGAAVFLASPAGGYMTGQHIVLDGGVLCEQVPRLQFMSPNPVGKVDVA